jgi:phage terminase large subunit-like protein
MNRSTEYASDVSDGSVLACKWVKLACNRHLDDLQRADVYLDVEEVDRRIDFIEAVLTLENGTPLILEPWECFIVGSIFGWKRTVDGLRKYNHALIMIPRKNGKSALVGAMLLSSFVQDGAPYSAYFAVASDRGQAGLLRDYVNGFIKRSPWCQNFLDIRTWEVRNRLMDSTFKALHADWRRLDGLNPKMVVFDEFHSQEGPSLDDVLNSSFGAQKEYLYIKISTAGVFSREKPCVKQQDFGEKVLEKVIRSDNTFYINWTIDDGDVWSEPSSWIKANPNLGVSKHMKHMEDLCAEAKELNQKQSDFLTKQLNVWVESSDIWITRELWDENGGTVDETALLGKRCYMGLDLAKVNDLSALITLFPPQDGLEKWTVLSRFYVPDEDIERRSIRDKVPYDIWRDEGYITSTPGNMTDFGFIHSDIVEMHSRFDVRELAYDRVFAGELIQGLMDDGVEVVPFGQGFISMASPTAEVERLVLGRLMNHGSNPVLSWNASNCVIRTDPAGNMKIDKSRASEKVDGMVALVMALGRASIDKDSMPEIFI